MKFSLGKAIVKSTLDLLRLVSGLGLGLRLSITEKVRKSPYVIKFWGNLAVQHSGIVVRERDDSMPEVPGSILGVESKFSFFF